MDTRFRPAAPEKAETSERTRWLAGLDGAAELAKSCPDTRVIAVCDREADRDVFLTPPRADATPTTYTVSVDEKPGVQAIGTTAPDLPPVAGQQATLSRDHEYVRHGTLSILAALDLHTGEIIAEVEPHHRSREFVALPERLHRRYPPDAVIRVVLDNHSAHISRETMAYLATRPGRFEYVHTPKHGSWLNLIECAFSKMARTFLRHIRVASTAELKSRTAALAQLRFGHLVKCKSFNETNY